MCQLDNRIGRPVAVMSTVQRTRRAKSRDLHGDHAPAAEGQLRRAVLVRGAITDHPHVGLQLAGIFRKNRRQMRRASLFLAFKKEPQIHGEW